MKSLLLIIVCKTVLFQTGFAQDKKNVLFIVADDMRAEIGAYKGVDPSFYKDIQTPNLDKFASSCLTFTRAYCQIALCSPSRTSFMTGRRPDTTKVTDLKTYWREAGGNFSTIAQYFKENGYHTVDVGKIFHSGSVSGKDDRNFSWSEEPYREPGFERWETKNHSWQKASPALEDQYNQRDTTQKTYAINKLRELAPGGISGDQPFFLAFGFFRPHLPFVAPEKFYDLYSCDDIDIASNPYVPENLHNLPYSKWPELRDYADIAALGIPKAFNTTVPDETAKKLRLAYYATVSFVDSIVGDLLDELDSLGLTNSTVVSFTSDHGYQLGEHAEWAKHTNFEVASQVPLMMRWPGMVSGGSKSSAFVELVDLFPSLVEAAGLGNLPLCPENSTNVLACHEGHSFVALDGNLTRSWKDAAFHQYPRGKGGNKMGYAIRTAAYKYVRWVTFNGTPNWNKLKTEELYDLAVDPDMNVNVAGNSSYATVKSQLNTQLQAGWRNAIPS